MDVLVPVELVPQTNNDNNCGPACLEMIYRVKGIKRTIEDILKDFETYPEGDITYISQLALDLLKNNIRTRVIISHPYILSFAFSNSSSSELIQKLKQWIPLHKGSGWIYEAVHNFFLYTQ